MIDTKHTHSWYARALEQMRREVLEKQEELAANFLLSNIGLNKMITTVNNIKPHTSELKGLGVVYNQITKHYEVAPNFDYGIFLTNIDKDGYATIAKKPPSYKNDTCSRKSPG